MTFTQSLWSLLPGKSELSRTASELYGRLVAQAREPAFYAHLGVPDTPEGRLELIVLHVVLVLRRLKREGDAGADPGRALAETFVADMDDCLREMGVGDISVAKKVKKAAAALYDRSKDYGRALDDADAAALARIVALHVLEQEVDPPPPAARRIADYALSTARLLEAASAADIAAGHFGFPALQHLSGEKNAMIDTSGLYGWTHTTAEIPPRGLDVVREATPQELAALAVALDVLGVASLKATYKLAPRTGGRYRLTGRLDARVVQACIVTLDPVASDICDHLDVEFRPDGDLPVEASAVEHELAALEAEEYEPIVQNRMEVGRVFTEALTAALPAYPRAPGAELETREAGPADGGAANPFAALAGWKPKAE